MSKTHWPQMSIGKRLALGFGGMVLLLAGVAAFNIVELRDANTRLQRIVEVHNAKVDVATRMLDQINVMAVQTRSITIMFFMKDTAPEFNAVNAAELTYREAEKSLQSLIEQGEATAAERQLLGELQVAATKTLPLIKDAAKAGRAGAAMSAATILTEKVLPNETVWRAKVGELIDTARQLSHQAYVESQQVQQRAMAVCGAVVAVGLVAGILLGWGVTRSVKRPIDRAIKVAERIAEGDLSSSVTVSSNDEIGRLLHAVGAMQLRLRDLVGQIRLSADSIQSASTEVASGNMDLSHRTEIAASNLQETAASIEQLTGTVRQSADAASQASQLAASAAAVASRGGEVVSQVVSTMSEINASSKRIADITAVIDGIAFQTNILALNAAVEAARAGEQGRGFAVVAGEVRSLAQRSAEAAKEIKALIGASVEKVEAGSKLVRNAGATMNEIVASVERVTHIVGEITASAAEQSDGIGQVNTSVAQLDQMTQQNAALVEQSAAAAESLKVQAVMLAGIVSTFRLERVEEHNPADIVMS
jgi:methyl-accepting chemotaxis protein